MAADALHAAATVSVNAGIAIAVGASASSLWLARGTSRWAAARLPALRRWALAGVSLAVLAHLVLLWLEAATMAEVPLAQAGPAVLAILGQTHYGFAWSIGMCALVAAAALRSVPSRGMAATCLLPLAVFLYTRSMVSHAASEGDFGWAMVADWGHLCLVSLWLGVVVVAGLAVLPCVRQPDGGGDRGAYIRSVSAAATVALLGIVASGLLGAWRNVGTVANAVGNPYARLLLLKIGLVLLAAMLGGFNRFAVMPALLGGDTKMLPRFVRVLRVEALVLFVVLVLAALLSATAPPGAG